MSNGYDEQTLRLMESVDCPKGLRCRESSPCKARLTKDGLVECLAKGRLCKFAHPFEYTKFCRCSVRAHLLKRELAG